MHSLINHILLCGIIIIPLILPTFASEDDMADHVCPPGSEPQLASKSVSRGSVIDLNGLPVYITGEGPTGVVVFYDIFGFDGGRVRTVCDQIGEAGFSVAMPDVFRGNPWMENRTDNRDEWLKLFPPQVILADFQAVVGYFQGKGISRLGAIGFCWGGFAVFLASSTGRLLAGVNCHPSLAIGARLFNIPETQQAEAVQCPQALLPAGNDPASVKPGGDVNKVLDTKPFGNQCVYHVFPDMSHGFVLRGDMSQPAVERDVKIAMDMSIDFFKRHLNT